jgi:hypothetical protein
MRLAPREAPPALLPAALRPVAEALRPLRGAERQAAGELLLWAAVSAPQLVTGRTLRGALYGEALCALAAQRSQFLRPVAGLQARGRSRHQLFASVAEQLLARWPVPEVGLSVFVAPEAHPNLGAFYGRLGQGENIRRLVPMVSLTRRAAHLFGEAPSELGSVFAALRWAQVRALGGGERIAREMAGTLLGRRTFPEATERFALQLMRWRVQHPELDRRRWPEVVLWALARAEERPSFAMGGRSMSKVVAAAQRWQMMMSEAGGAELRRYERSGVETRRYPREVRGGGEESWRFVEVTDSLELYREGDVMRHCVFTYADEVEEKRSAIFSLVREQAGWMKRALTVEVDLEKQAVIEARGRHNRDPTAEELCVLEAWTRDTGLRLELE